MAKRMILNLYRIWCVPFILFFVGRKHDEILFDEAAFWWRILELKEIPDSFKVLRLSVNKREYRNLFEYRLKQLGHHFLALIYHFCFPGYKSLHLSTSIIGPRLFIQHGFSTFVAAEKIGSDCWINQQVTIGYDVDNPNAPIIGNGVRICCGAKVIGDVTIGDNAIVGANAVVIKDVDNNSVVGGIPAKKISENKNHLLYKVGT